ncbi:MAG: hypothetical protein VKJ46_13235, partial [Leptolyngbyaceae bacterium]|nr:hypothetical protein [Leptolyngbyaceae bacterium]
SGSGKTCYMLGMYAEMQLGKRGFTLSAQNTDENIRLSTLWDQLLTPETGDYWPSPTVEKPHPYTFEFSYGFKPLIEFEWLDYPGNTLSGPSTDTDTQDLRNHLLASSCVFLSISGEYLDQSVDQAQLMALARKAKANFMSRYLVELRKTIKPTNQNPFPIVILITKYDLCYMRHKELIEDIKKIFEPLFMPNSGWLVMICPVSLGKDLASHGHNRKIDPKNLHLPLLFSLYFKFQMDVAASQKQANEVRQALTTFKKHHWITRWLKRKEIKTLKDDLQALQTAIEDSQSKMALLGQELSNIPLYLSGREIQVD